jgi:hypothetical protein
MGHCYEAGKSQQLPMMIAALPSLLPGLLKRPASELGLDGFAVDLMQVDRIEEGGGLQFLKFQNCDP